MTVYGPSQAGIMVGGVDLRGSDTLELTETQEQVLETEARGLGETWDKTLPVGLAKVMLEAGGGFYDDRTAGILAALQEKGSTLQLVAFWMSGNVNGQDCALLNGTYVTRWRRAGARDGLTKANGTHTITGDYKRGKIIHALGAETTDPGSTEGPSVDNTASSANGATAQLHVSALTLGGFTNIDIRVRHSVDDITYADLTTFTAVTAAPAAEQKTVAGTINRHLACSWNFTGAGSGQSVTFFVGVNRG